MKKYMESYHVFLTNALEQILMYVLYPVGMLFATWIIGILIQGAFAAMHAPDAKANAAIIGAFVIVIELVLDMLVFGGLLSKDTNKLEYLKTSKRGMEVLKKGVIVDKVRRILMIGAYLCVGYVICHTGGSFLQILSLVMVLGIIIELGLLVTRRYGSITVLFVVGTMASALCTVGCNLIFALPSLCFPIFLVLYVGMTIISHKLIMKRLKKSFLDEAN